LITFVLGSCLQLGCANSWPKRVDDSRGLLNIDEPQAGMYEGSASGDRNNDDEDFDRNFDNFPPLKTVKPPVQPPVDRDDDEELVVESEDVHSGDGPSSTTALPKKHCEMLRDEKSNPFLIGAYIPQCNEQGEYHPIQCHSSTGHCWCVDNGGVEIVGTRVTAGHTRPTCDSTVQIPAVTTKRPILSAGHSTTTASPKTPCQRKRQEAQTQKLFGAFIPKCTEDGQYESVQCNHDNGPCWCVDEQGEELDGTRTTYGQRPDCEEVDHEVIEDVIVPKFELRPEAGGPGADVHDPTSEDDHEEEDEDEDDGDNKIDQMPEHGDTDPSVTWDPESNNIPEGSMHMQRDPIRYERSYLFDHPGLLAAIIGGAVFGLLCAVLLVMFIVYRMRKKDEGSYPLDERKRPPVGYTRAYQREMYA